MADLIVRSLGQQPYMETWEAMKSFTANRDEATVDELWCLEHPRVFTQGQAGKAEHILLPGDIPVIQVDRGGQVTYHGPGQLVIYLLIDLTRRKLGVRNLVSAIEQAIVRTLAQGGIEAAPRSDAPGVYVNGAKIASLGLRVRRGCSFHGLALNVNMDMEPFSRINPCGYAGMSMCQVSDFEAGASVYDLERRLVSELVEGLGHCQVEQRQGW
ncbi:MULTISPECIES: lipoyl(octanoyl) transferase LipB [Marinobacter]|nr:MULTISPECIES: lipoyl(octanoyl) transferase LipB [Marinobacter]MBN8240334.1 lipoyl(octanoyl) transferase LipB [Marinobacter nauticus]MEC9385336.1 lipoyl(octanoyl) transferase LipB [Pseudomonadota bacterium]CCG94321.1 lipoyl-protein ligase [Marinobacter nauticus ATCC 49840]